MYAKLAATACTHNFPHMGMLLCRHTPRSAEKESCDSPLVHYEFSVACTDCFCRQAQIPAPNMHHVLCIYTISQAGITRQSGVGHALMT